MAGAGKLVLPLSAPAKEPMPVCRAGLGHVDGGEELHRESRHQRGKRKGLEPLMLVRWELGMSPLDFRPNLPNKFVSLSGFPYFTRNLQQQPGFLQGSVYLPPRPAWLPAHPSPLRPPAWPCASPLGLLNVLHQL